MQRVIRTAVFVVACVGAATAPRTTHTQSASCLVSTLNGPVQGVDSGDSCVFAGIPYAAPPLGQLRWKPPQPAPSWTFLNANTQSNCPSIRFPESCTHRQRRLSQAERLGEGSLADRTRSGDRVAAHRRILRRLGESRVSQSAAARSGNRSDRRRPQLSTWSIRVSRSQRADGRRPAPSSIRQLRAHGPTRGAGMGARQHRAVRRRPAERHARRDFSRRRKCGLAAGLTRKCRLVSPCNRAERRRDGPLA